MSLYNLKNAFHIQVGLPIWRIEIDEKKQLIAVESRQQDGSKPQLSVYTFQGEEICSPLQLPAKEWTLASIQGDYIVCKKFGSATPLAAGVLIYNFRTSEAPSSFLAHHYLEALEGAVKVRHQNFQTGFEEYVLLGENTLRRSLPTAIKPFVNKIVYPLHYQGKRPKFLAPYAAIEDLWISQVGDKYIWTYYQKNQELWDIKLLVSNKYEVFAEATIAEGLKLRVPTIYFQVEEQIFLLTDNKQEIVSYLV